MSGDDALNEVAIALEAMEGQYHEACEERDVAREQARRLTGEVRRLRADRDELLETVDELTVQATMVRSSPTVRCDHMHMGVYEDAIDMLVRLRPERWVATPTGMEQIGETPLSVYDPARLIRHAVDDYEADHGR